MLTDAQAKRAKGAEKPYKLADGGGLFLLVATSGHRSWRLKYRLGGKEGLLTFGAYPDLSIVEARAERDKAKRMIREGLNPALEKKKAAAAKRHDAGNSFEAVARAWYEVNKGRWTEVHAGNVITSLENDIFPDLGSVPIRDITPSLVLSVLRPIEERGAIETSKRIRQRLSAVFVYGIASGICDTDPAATVKGALRPLPKKGRQPALTKLPELQALLAAVEAEPASPVTKLGHRLLALTSVRPGEARGARWGEFEAIDWDGDAPAPAALWRIPAERMKLKLDKKDEEIHDHLVPLSPSAVEVLRAIRPLTGRSPYVLPNERWAHRPMSENAIGYLINRAGYRGKHVPHGWRAAFSTVMNEWAQDHGKPGDRQVIDAMLAHVPKEKVEAAYNRAGHHKRRRELAAAWAELLLAEAAPAATLLDGKRN
nr:protein of unknown function DUF4102 [uncultured organism]